MSMITEWYKSTFSGAGGCVEVRWQTSTFSGADCCVEVGTGTGEVLVRDTKDRSLPAHAHSPAAWAAFLAGIRSGELR
jgi:uncharacterized protein DUF397